MLVPVAVRSEAKVLAACLLRSRVGIPLRTWMFAACRYMFCCPRHRPCDELITYPRSPVMCVSKINVRNKWVMKRPGRYSNRRNTEK
jgi:hypothetical protein